MLRLHPTSSGVSCVASSSAVFGKTLSIRSQAYKTGDVVEEINGILLTDTAQAIKLLNSLRNESEIEIRVVRGGKPINFLINVQ